MKRPLLLALLIAVSASAWAQDLNRSQTLTIWFNPLGLLSSQAEAAVEFRFASTYSALLGVTYGYGGRVARPEGNFVTVRSAVKVFNDGLMSAHTNWYSMVLGDVKFLQLDSTVWGVGAAFGYTASAARFVVSPELSSELWFTGDVTFGLKLNTGVFVN